MCLIDFCLRLSKLYSRFLRKNIIIAFWDHYLDDFPLTLKGVGVIANASSVLLVLFFFKTVKLLLVRIFHILV